MQPQVLPHARRKLADLNLDDLADELGINPSGSAPHTAAMAEFTRREALAQERVAQAQEAAADAAKITAEATCRSARNMLWSVIVLAVASVASLAWNLWEYH
jgi:hypothetical protein